MIFHFSYLQAIITALIQGVTELFPISSLGHTVLVPAWIGGSWAAFSESPTYFLVAIALHLGSAIALFIAFAPRWFVILRSTLTLKKNESGYKVFMLLLIGTIPVGAIGLVFNNYFQKNFEKPLSAAIFLFVNGLILLGAERLTRRRHVHLTTSDPDVAIVERISNGQALVIGVGQSAALFAGISRFGITMSFGMLRGLSRSLAADFAFLLSFPVILGASLFKLPKLAHGGLSGLYGPLIVGTIIAFFATFISVKVLIKWFKTQSLLPFAYYCLFIGMVSIVKFGF
jgi:undecaprenyl-diphosphatase